MTAIKSEIRPKEQAFLQHVYNRFKAECRWPIVRDLQIELVDLGRIQAVADTIGGEYVWCDPPGDKGVCALEIKGVAICEGSQGDIENFLATIRYAAQCYVETKSRPCISGAILRSALGMTQPDAKRACVLLQCGHGLGGNSRPIDDDVEITVGDDIVHYQGVQSLEEFWGRAERLRQQIMQAGSQSISRRVVKAQSQPSQRPPTVMFEHVEKIADDAIRALVERDARELQQALHAEMWKAAVILAGGCAEAVLLDLWQRHPRLIQKHFRKVALRRAFLGTLIDKARDAKLITEAERDAASAIRHWRNLTHASRALADSPPGPEMAQAAVALLNLLLSTL